MFPAIQFLNWIVPIVFVNCMQEYITVSGNQYKIKLSPEVQALQISHFLILFS